MWYSISRNSFASQFIEVKLEISCKASESVNLQVAAWRPGRYELQHFAQKIRGFRVFYNGTVIEWTKITKDLWQFDSKHEGQYQVCYQFYANQMDAGGSWSDDLQLYLNFSNFCFRILGRENEQVSLKLDLPPTYQVATALPMVEGEWKAKDYFHLIDSPILSGTRMTHRSYHIGGTTFHLYFLGDVHFDLEALKHNFLMFTRKQLQAFGNLPVSDYYFLFQLLPYPHYHGVEHAASTVITIGPAEQLGNKENLDELMGISSHELYHAWNVCRIRPVHFLPYDFSKETYFEEGLVLEGITTYMGDLYLIKSGYFDLADYLKIIQVQIQKESENWGWKNQSIAESSFDLWLDGYKPGIPDKKVSIYNRGALICLCLDLMLIKAGSSLEEVMLMMWKKFGIPQIGYTMTDFLDLVSSPLSENTTISCFRDNYIYGRSDLLQELFGLLEDFGISIEATYEGSDLTQIWGIKTDLNGIVIKVHPLAKAYNFVMLGDSIMDWMLLSESQKQGDLSCFIKVNRQGREIDILLEQPKENPWFFPLYLLKVKEINHWTDKWIK
jgi:predicted metalloprotease with PDZ domain